MSKSSVVSRIIGFVIAILLLQTLYYKFSAHPDSIYIFEQTGLGTTGRIGIGVLELIAAILLIIPKTSWMGAVLTLGIISGAIFFHLTSLGIEINSDGGKLFYMALGTFLAAAIKLFLDRNQFLNYLSWKR